MTAEAASAWALRDFARTPPHAPRIAKAYGRLLLTLPPELRESAIQYRQLKKIINQIVAELTALGPSAPLPPSSLPPLTCRSAQGSLQASSRPSFSRPRRRTTRANNARTTRGLQAVREPPLSPEDAHSSPGPRVIYELVHVADHPRLPTNTRTPSPSIPHTPNKP